ncbi:MAG: AraC family transcriptional regulator [Anaerolineales bacterium]|nr:AraC family transcriptional regulator [Anaerolineales bacterium]
MATIRKREGFEGQIMYVIPRPMLKKFAQHVLIHQLIATDIGWYPKARYHYRERPSGAPEHILILCIDGQGWCEIDGKREVVDANQALVIPRNTPHIYGASDDAPWSIHWAHFMGTVSDYFPHLLPDGVYTMAVAPDTIEVLERLFHECYGAFLGSFAWQRMVHVTQTLHCLLGNLFFNNSLFSPILRTSQSRNLDRTLDYLSDNLDQPLSLQDMADQANLSKSHFSRVFKDQIGFSPTDYFIHLKVQHAAMLLSFTDKTVREISFEVGYQDPYYFSRVFKNIIGLSPTDFRKHSE